MVERVSPREAKRRIDEDGYVYVDVRSVPEFQQGHPTGAYNVPLMHMGAAGMQPNPDFLPVFEALFDKDAKIVVGCRSGGRSLRAAEMLEAQGWSAVVDQRAGWSGAANAFGQVDEPGWEAAGLGSATEPEPGRGYEELRAKAEEAT